MTHSKFLVLLCAFTLVISSCSDQKDPLPINPEELITTVNIVLTPVDEGDSLTFKSEDLDAQGPNPPEISGGTLLANTQYNAVISLLNETSATAIDITEEVAEEAEDHQFFYSASEELNLSFAYRGENDSNGNPVGIYFRLTSKEAGTGTFTLTLKHQPNKFATGVKEGDISNAGGETDIEVSFPVTVQ
ncbi:MAG: type 1 periplasmic binding fold superfamily protein [Tenacibaculum sp.]